jgi:high-affinity iron transporter
METTLKSLKVSWWKPALGLLLVGLWLTGAGLALADASQDDLTRINSHVEKALAAAQAGNVSLAQTEFKAFDDAWFDIEDGIRAKSKDFYRNIEDRMHVVDDVFAKTPVDSKALQQALDALNKTNLAFIQGAPLPGAATTPAASTPTTTGTPSIVSLLGVLDTARDLQAKGDWAGAAAAVKTFQTDWLDVEGQVKTRSADAYRDTENDMALAYNLANQKSPELKTVLDRMSTRLEPYREANTYGIFDATIILLREGLEALLVVVALLAFLKKSGNAAKQSWVWSGALAGLVVSIALGMAIQMLFSSAINSSNREMIEGITGLVAAVMLIYVSYWMHNKSSTVAWQRYIKRQSTNALAKGSLLGFAVLSFLAIFREGAETVLFFLGMGSNISLTDLLLGLAIGTFLLAILGVLLVVVGVRIPMGPFFRVASILVFYLCFKFVGTGVHALQVGGVLPSTAETYLPENGFFGLFPTWETTTAQLILLAIGAGIVGYTRFKSEKEREEVNPAKPVETANSQAVTK